MSVTIRPYRRGGWEVDIRVVLPDDSEHRQRRKAPVASKSAALRWAEDREREWYYQLTHPKPNNEPAKEVPTLARVCAAVSRRSRPRESTQAERNRRRRRRF